MAFRKRAFGSRSFWTGLGADARTMYQDEIFEKGQNVYGSKWWNGKYSDKYGSAKRGQKFKVQHSGYSDQVTAVLTGKTYLDFEGFFIWIRGETF